MASNDDDPLAWLNELSTSQVVLVAIKLGLDVPESLLAMIEPERLERARAMALRREQGAKEGASEADLTPSEAAKPLPD
jgi:hypothetical protein